MTLKDKIKNTRRKHFFNPIHANPYYPNTISCIRKSDIEYFEKYASKWRDGKESEEFSDLSSHEIDMIYCYADSILDHVIDDYIFENDEKIYEYFLSKNLIIGKPCEWDEYPEKREDFLGNPIESAEYKYFASNYLNIEGERFLLRDIYLSNDEYSENVTFFKTKDRRSILFLLQEDEDSHEFEYYLDTDDEGRLIFAQNVRFVENLDSNEQILSNLRGYLENGMDWGDFPIKAIENSCSMVKYSNPFNYEFGEGDF